MASRLDASAPCFEQLLRKIHPGMTAPEAVMVLRGELLTRFYNWMDPSAATSFTLPARQDRQDRKRLRGGI